MAAEPTLREVLDALRDCSSAEPKQPHGAGWFTLDQLADGAEVTIPTMRYRLRVARRRKDMAVEVFHGMQADGSGKLKRMSWYRITRKREPPPRKR